MREQNLKGLLPVLKEELIACCNVACVASRLVGVCKCDQVTRRAMWGACLQVWSGHARSHVWWVYVSLIRSRVEPCEVGVFESDQVTHGAMRGVCVRVWSGHAWSHERWVCASLIRSRVEPCEVGVCEPNQLTRRAMRGVCLPSFFLLLCCRSRFKNMFYLRP